MAREVDARPRCMTPADRNLFLLLTGGILLVAAGFFQVSLRAGCMALGLLLVLTAWRIIHPR